ncbi:MAG: hypothetical protein AMXMBFR84_42460 [Candidatus Hydrogenedentota bacterium]
MAPTYALHPPIQSGEHELHNVHEIVWHIEPANLELTDPTREPVADPATNVESLYHDFLVVSTP